MQSNKYNSQITCFDRIINNLKTNKNNALCTKSSENIQTSTKECTVLMGFHSLRCTVINNINNTAYTISPADIIIDDVIINHMGSELSVFNENDTVSNQIQSLKIDGGQIFQLSTMYDCDFSFIKFIMPKYLEVLTALKECSFIYNSLVIDEAIENVKDAVKFYEEE